jgi:superfamily II DNA or RNA helicase
MSAPGEVSYGLGRVGALALIKAQGRATRRRCTFPAVTDLRPGLRDELVTRATERALRDVSDGRVERAPLEPAEAPERLGRHLAAVARRLLTRMSESAMSAHEQAAVVNRAIELLAASETADDDTLVVPPDLMTGIRAEAMGLGTAYLPPAPVIPLSANELLVNGHGQPAIGQQLRSELPSADRVDFLVSFVRWTGLRTLLDELRRVTERGGQLRAITTTYMGATEPRALNELVAAGAEVRVAYDAERTKLHAKTWLLHRPGGLTTAYLGSSNVSYTALHQGLEWNVRLSEAEAGSLIERMRATFDSYWDDDAFEPYDPESDAERLSEALRQQGRRERAVLGTGYVPLDVHPHRHQVRLLEQLQMQRDRHDRHRNLLVAATGTGKTVMAALDYRRLRERAGGDLSLLFVAHRRRILDQSRATFATVLKDPEFGELLGDGHQPERGRHVFAMVQSLSNETVEALAPQRYDVVIIDEVHHAAASGYRALLEHLAPQELLGLTATPERMDGQDITRWFGSRTAAELRLWEAIDDNFLAPFQYFGVHDGIDLSSLEWRRGGYRTEDLNRLYTGDDERVKRLIEALERIVLAPDQMRALGFCVSVEHARFMAAAFADRNLPSAALWGDVDTAERDRVLARLERGELRCVFSVDVLGEGVDVPSVDTVLLLRPTQSATVLTQQIGRGLRQYRDKTTLTVVDLIGQQHRRFRFDYKLRALLDPRNGSLLRQAEVDFPYLPAGCEIKLDRASREVVLSSLRQVASAGMWRVVVDDLHERGDIGLRQFLRDTDRSLSDIYRDSERSWTRLRRDAGLPTPRGDEREPSLLRAMHRLLHVDDPERVAFYREVLGRAAPPSARNERQRRLLAMLANALFTRGHGLRDLDGALAALWRNDSVRTELAELLALLDEESESAPRPLGILAGIPLSVHARYTRAEALVALGDGTFEKPPSSREGVRWLEELQTDVLFVTLRKSDRHYSPTTRYRDFAISPNLFHWESQSTTGADSPTGRRYRNQRESGTHVLLFVREDRVLSTGAGAPFWCLGPATIVRHESERPMQITWELHEPMPESLLEIARLVAA